MTGFTPATNAPWKGKVALAFKRHESRIEMYKVETKLIARFQKSLSAFQPRQEAVDGTAGERRRTTTSRRREKDMNAPAPDPLRSVHVRMEHLI
jgi:phage baseplate assembly protein W